MALKIVAGMSLMLVIVAAARGGLTASANTQLATDKSKEFHSEAGSFEIIYPNDWTPSTETKGNSLVVVFTSPMVRDDDVFQAARIMVCSTPINETPWNDCTERDSHLSDLYKDSVRSRKVFFVSGLKIERVETASQYDSAFFYYARFSSNNRKFFVRGNFKKYFNLDRYAPVFDKMLESFRFSSVRSLTTHSTLSAEECVK